MNDEERERRERRKEYRRRYEEKHGIKRHHYTWKKPLAAAILLCIVGTGGFFIAQSKAAGSVTLDGQLVSSMSDADIRTYLDTRESSLSKKSIDIKGQDIDETLSLDKLDGQFDRQRIKNEIRLVGRVGTPLERVQDVYKTLRYGKDVPLSIKVDETKLADSIDSIQKKYDVKPRDAYAEPDGQDVTIHKERAQIVIDPDELTKQVKADLAQGKTDAIDAPVSKRTEADIKKEDLKGIDTVLSSYTTHFDPDADNRDDNIALCTRLLNKTLVPASKDFSFNDTVGTRTREKGYKDAPVYFDNKVVMDAGGGVCQVSTTLFNAVLRAGMIIAARSPHFAPAGYVPVGMDATVADGSLDFGFTNPFQHPVYIYTEYGKGNVTVYVLGHHDDTCTVSFQTLSQKTLPHKVIHKHDDSVTEDVREQEGYDGHDISIRRNVLYKDGQTYHDTIASHYDPNSTIIRTAGPSYEETVQTTNLDGDQPQDNIINSLHDPTTPVEAPAETPAEASAAASDATVPPEQN